MIPAPEPSGPTLPRPSENHAQADRLTVGVALGLLLALSLKVAWVADDALITMRTVDNLVSGHGPVWNLGERVQAYTHPLWMFLLAAIYALGRAPFLTPLIAGLLCTAAAAAILALGVARSAMGALVALTTLAFSKAFAEYSTSGLENALSHLLLATLLMLYLRRPATPAALFRLALVTCLLALTRQDLLLLAAPPLAVAALAPGLPATRTALAGRGRDWGAAARALLSPARIGAVALGFLPLAAWMLFSLFYYGFPFPNTAYAKLNTGLSSAELVSQGLLYLINAAEFDPLTPLAIGLGMAIPLARRDWWAAAASLGIALYLAYVVRVGGDFMSGRFLTAPLIAAMGLAAAGLPASPRLYALAATAALMGALNPRGALVVDSEAYRGPAERNGVADERFFYAPNAALAQIGRQGPFQTARYQVGAQGARTQPVLSVGVIGYFGLAAGRESYIVDPFALSDPLLARLPARFDPQWRPGHFLRAIPEGYLESVAGPANQLRDPGLAAFYNALRLITRGALLDPERLATIWRMNTGGYSQLIDADAYRFPGLQRLPYAEVASLEVAPRPLSSAGIAIEFAGPQRAERLAVAYGGRDDLLLLFYRQGAELARLRLPAREDLLGAATLHEAAAPPAALAGYDELRIFPLSPGTLSLGALLLLAPGEAPAATEAVFGPEWQLSGDPEQGARWATSPASLLVTSPAAQPLWLELVPGQIFDPATPDGFGDRGELSVSASGRTRATVSIERGRPIVVPLALPAGDGWIELALAAGNFLPVDYGGGLRQPIAFAAATRLYTVRDRPPPADLRVDGQPQRGQPGRHLIYLGSGWHTYEERLRLRWAAGPAELQIFSPRAGQAALKLDLPYLYDGRGIGTAGRMHVSLNGAPAEARLAFADQPFVVALALAEGWNSVRLELESGSVRAAALDPDTPNDRELSFAAGAIELVTAP